MFELMGGGLLGSIFGGLFRLIPEMFKLFDAVNERKHELEMFRLQTDLEKLRGTFRMEEKYVEHGTAQLTAIQEAFNQQGKADAKAYKWVASLSALVRPGITFILFGLYVAMKLASIGYAINSGGSWEDVVFLSWKPEDFAMLNMILTFWFVGRALEKYQGK